MSDVFVIHATPDDATATRIHFALASAGISTWVDHIHGEAYSDFVMQARWEALEDCETGLLLLSPASIDSRKCRQQWKAILREHKQLMVAIIDLIPPDDLPDELWTRAIPYIDLMGDIDGGITELIHAIGGLVSF